MSTGFLFNFLETKEKKRGEEVGRIIKNNLVDWILSMKMVF